MKLKVFEAFAGYGSQSMALERLKRNCPEFDYEVVGFAEVDSYAIKAYRAVHGEDIPNLGDVTKIDWGGYDKDVDLFTYSFPCQDISTAGKQRGFAQGIGSRSSLLWECERAIREKRPKYLLMENVKALTQEKFRADFRRWREVLQDMGYKNYVQVMNATDYGVPQHRERVFMVSMLNGDKPFYFPKPFALEKRLKDVLEDEVDEKYYLSDERIEGMLYSTSKERERGNGFKFEPVGGEDIAHTIQTTQNRKTDNFLKVMQVGNIYPKTGNPQAGRIYSDKGVSPALDTMEGGNRQPKVITCASRTRGGEKNLEFGGEVANCITSVNTDSMVAEAKIIQRGRGYNKGGDFDICPTISTSSWEHNNMVAEPKIILENEGGANVSQERRVYSPDGISCVIDTSCPGRPKIGEHGETYRIRRITPREAFRLMDVSEEDIDKMIGAGISNSQLYKLAGNSIVVSCLYHIFRKMFVDTDAEKGQQLSLF